VQKKSATTKECSAVLARTKGNRTKAVKELGIGRATFYRFLKDRTATAPSQKQTKKKPSSKVKTYTEKR